MVPLNYSSSKRILLATIVIGLASAEPARSQSRSAVRETVARVYDASSSCYFNRILLSPNGTQFAALKSENSRLLSSRYAMAPFSLVVGRLRAPSDQAQDPVLSYSGGGLRRFPIRWAASGARLYIRVREREQRIITVDGTQAAPVEVAQLHPAWRRFDIGASMHGDVAPLTDPSNIARAAAVDGMAFLRRVTTLGRGAPMIGVRGNDLLLVRFDESRTTATQVNANETTSLTLPEDLAHFDEGLAYLGAPRRGSEFFLPYQLPIVD